VTPSPGPAASRHGNRRRPPGRYDEPGQGSGKLLAVVMTALVLGLAAVAGSTLWERFGGERATAQVVDFQVLSDDVVRIDVQVTKPAGSAAYCLLRARGADGAEVGREVVTLAAPGTAGETVRREHELATRDRAVTGEAGACSLEPVPDPVTDPPTGPGAGAGS
jgi:hypothetical protein